MKKVFLFLSILMFAFTGVFFACSEDRYADLKISVNSVASTSANKKVTYNKAGKYYEVLYDDEFVINASVTCSNDISTSLEFTSINDESVHKVGSTNTQNGTKATFKAVAPSYDEFFRIKIESVETNRKAVNIYIKVVLPVDEINLTDNLGVTFGNPVDLNSQEALTYVSVDPSAPYETNEKGVDFALTTYTDLNSNTYTLFTKENDPDSYYFKNGEEKEIKAFSLTDDVLVVLDETVEGSVKVSGKSIMFDEDIASIEIDTATEEEKELIEDNDKLKDETDVSIVKPVALDDISFIGGQVVFKDYNSDSVKDAKLTASLYLNSLDTYKVGEVNHYYNYENIHFAVNTKARIQIAATTGSITVDGKKVESDINVLKLPEPENLLLSQIVDNDTGEVVGYETDIKLSANGGSGFAYVDFVVQYKDFANKLEYSFADLYNKYLASLDADELALLDDNAKTQKLVFEATALPSNISLTQDDKNIDNVETIKIYDAYSNSNGFSAYGTKINVNLTLSSGTMSSKIKDENKGVRVFVSDAAMSGLDVRNYFDIYDSLYNRIILQTAEIEETVVYFFNLDLTKSNDSYFYVKASKDNLATDANFTFSFENILKSSIKTYTNEVIEANSEFTTLKNLTTSFTAKTVKGVEDILVLSKVVTAEDNFYALDNVNVDTESQYNKLVLRIAEGEQVTDNLGSVIAFMTNLFVADNINISYDETVLKLFTLNNDDFIASFDGSYNDDVLEFKGVLSVVGIKICEETRIVFTAENGYEVVVLVEVVESYQGVSIDVNQSYGKNIIAENFINAYNNPKSYDVSAKVNGTFNIVYNVNPNASAISGVNYISSQQGIVEINPDNGMVSTISKGDTIITIEFNYYKFEEVNGYYQWVNGVETKSFKLKVFVPATSIKLDKRIVNVYSYESLGYEYRDQSLVELNVLIYPESATIANSEENVSFVLSNNNENLIGNKGIYTAFLNKNETKAVVYIVVRVEEFGTIATLTCTVNIYKAPQVEEIKVSAFEGSNPVKIDISTPDEDGHDVYYVSTQNDRKLTFNTSIIPGEREVLVDDLVVVVFKADQDSKEMLDVDKDRNYASVSYGNNKDYTVITNGQDSFYLETGTYYSGYFYLVVFSRDSLTSETEGTRFVKILIQITDGTQANPYVVRSAEELIAIGGAPTKHYVLGNDINLSSISNWTPIKNFAGSLNGYNINIADRKNPDKGTYFKVTGLKINTVKSANVGLFEKIANTNDKIGAVMNLKLGVSSINLTNYTVSNAIAEDTINIGSIAGLNDGVIVNCSVEINTFRVSLTNKNANVGGMVGANGTGVGCLAGGIINFSNNATNASDSFNLDISDEDNITKQADITPTSQVEMISANPVNGVIIVSDKKTIEGEPAQIGQYVFVGGMVGYNNGGFINGIYGIYNLANEKSNFVGNASSVSYLTNYQSQGIDVKININYGAYADIGLIENEDSAIGGVVGTMDSGSINNISVEGHIGMIDNMATRNVKGAYNNVGGVVGKTRKVSTDDYNKKINTVSANVQLRANDKVGGIAGSTELTNISKARVESYEQTSGNTQTLIIANNHIGGVVGSACSTNITYAYSYSFVNDFNTDYMSYGDIYSFVDESILGGLVGSVSKDEDAAVTTIKQSYSTFNVIASGENCLVAGLVGNAELNSYPILEEVFYIGVLFNATEGEEDSTAKTTFAYNVKDDPSFVTGAVNGYNFYYILQYADSTDIENGTNLDCLIIAKDESFVKKCYAGDESLLTSSISTEKVLKVEIYDDESGSYEKTELALRVPAYGVTIDGNPYVCNFIRYIPSSIEVDVDGDPVAIVGGNLSINFGDSDKYYSYVDTNGDKYLIINYAVLNNTFDLGEIFEITPNPVISGNLNILVSSSDSKNLVITDIGELVVNKVGYYELTFRVKENVNATAVVKVLVLKNFDELLLSNTPTFKTSLFDNNSSNPYDLRVKNQINTFNIFAEYVLDAQGQVTYGTVADAYETKYLTQITNTNNYSLEYIVEYKETASFILATADQYIEENGSIKFLVTGEYRITIKVVFKMNSFDFEINNSEWVVYFNIFDGATNINFNTDEIWLQGQEIYDKLQLTLNSDVGDYESLSLVVDDSLRQLEYKYIYDAENNVMGEKPEIYDYSTGEKVIVVEEIDYPFNISVQETSAQNDIYYYTVIVSIRDNFKAVSQPERYTLYAYDGRQALINTPADVEIVIAPQSLKGVSGIHYAYTQQVSKLTNVGNTEADSSEGNGAQGDYFKNYSYSFTNEPKNTIIAGNEGLFVIDLYPFYANITSVSIDSNIGKDSGNALQFVQLVKIKGNAGNYYIYAPLTQSTNNNGIFLNLYSFVPEDVATINYTSESSSEIIYKNADKKLTYKFFEADASTSSETARLYVKTIAPTNLKDEEQFVVTVTVKYNVVNESGVLEERSYQYEHNLVVESVPGFAMKVAHDGIDRDIIAYTGTGTAKATTADWLEIIPIVEEGYTYDSITPTLVRGDKTFGSSEYVELRPNNILILGKEARAGDKIIISAVVKIDYEGYTESRVYTKTINVVDVVISSITVKDLDPNNDLKITVSTSRQLRAEIIGFGLEEAIEDAELRISRSVTLSTNTNYYWQAKSNKSGEQYVNLESVSLRNYLPFVVNKIAISNEESEVTINSEFIGAAQSVNTQTFKSLSKVMVLEGSTDAGTVEMRLALSYVYEPVEGKIVFVPNTFDTFYTAEKYFNVVVTEDSNEDNPTPIYDEEDLKTMTAASTGSFILMNDITIDNHTALKANFSSFDGNNKVITINNFTYSTDIISSTGNHSINLGLFDTVSADTVIKNVIVAYPADKTSAMNLKGYSEINFGGIAAINNGVITNCDVISTVYRDNVNLGNYTDVSYTLNIQTATSISGNEVVANIGGLVAVNSSTGFVTNSRVGRDEVDILYVYDSEATVVYKDKYKHTAPVTVFKVYGRANVGGFVADNQGTISTSFAKNMQLEIISESPTSFVKTGGFVVNNTGFIYGSYAAGWEEENGNIEDYTEFVSTNRKLGGGIYSNGFVGGFVFNNESYIEDCYSNINVSGDLIFAAKTDYIKYLMNPDGASLVTEWPSPAVGGFVYKTATDSYITTSYSLSKIYSGKLNTHGAFEGRDTSPDPNFTNTGTIENCYFMQEKTEDFDYDHERARMLSDDPVINLEGQEDVAGTNEFVEKKSFNNFSFDNSITNFYYYDGESTGGVWAIYQQVGSTNGYPELISANTIAMSCRVINVTKTNNSETNTYYYTYVDGYDIGSYLNPHLVANFEQYNNIFKDAIGQESFNENITTKFTGNIRLIKNINFSNSEEVYSTSVEYTSLINLTSIFDGNYLAMYNIKLSDTSSGKSSFGLFKDIYYAAVKNVTLSVTSVNAGNTTTVGALAGAIVNSNVSNITLVASSDAGGIVTGNNYVGGLAGIVISSDTDRLNTISDIQSNLSVVGSISSSSQAVSAVTTSNMIWEKIKPTSSSSGLSEVNNNLRLHRLPSNVYYGGGVVGLADLTQIIDVIGNSDIEEPNLYNIHVGEFIPNTILADDSVDYDQPVSIISDYAGGLFGFVGSQTYVECAEFIATTENEEHFISANEVAGGIAAINFGKISQTYVSFNKDVITTLEEDMFKYVSGDVSVDVNVNSTLFDSGTPNYIGGIVGVNAGDGRSYGSGFIIDSYNRVDVRNSYAKGVGGIVGGTYIGELTNVYTTASLLGNLTSPDTKIGGIIGKIFESAEEGYFADYAETNSDYSSIALSNIVSANLWDTEDFDALYEYVNSGAGYVGALYGKFENKADATGKTLVKENGGIFVENYVLRDFSDPDISTIGTDDKFNPAAKDAQGNDLLEVGSYFELWGVQAANTYNYDSYLYSFLCDGEANESIIAPNDFRALFSGTDYGVSTLRDVYFAESKWSRTIWNYNDDILLPILDYGYESSVIRIFTANQFINTLKEGNSSGKLYVIMNDLDFKGVDITPITTTFRGQLYGNNITYKIGEKTYQRKPILFNIECKQTNMTSGVFAILQNSTGATFSNFNMVLSKYDVTFSDILDSETIASVLLGSATNTSISNVNIYSSLNDEVSKESMLDYKFANTVEAKKSFTVTQGYYIDDTNKEIGSYSPVGYLKLATLRRNDKSSTDDKSYSYNYIFTANVTSDTTFEFKGKFDAIDNSSVALTEDEQKDYQESFDNADPANNISYTTYPISVTHNCVAKTNASTVGLFVGVGSLSYISSSNVSVDINVNYTRKPSTANGIKYVGAIAGRNIGEIRYVVSNSSISVTSGITLNDYDIEELYFGGIVGNIQGVLRFLYVRNNDLTVGTAARPIVARTGSAGTFMGSIVGAVDRYTTVNEAIVGGANFLYITNTGITAYLRGLSNIAGVIGQNSFTVGDIYYKQNIDGSTQEAKKAINVNVDDESSSITIGGIIATNKSTYVTNAYNNTSIYVNLGKYTKLVVGGIIAQTDNNDCELTNVVNDAKEIKVTRTAGSTMLGTVFIGGILADATAVGATVNLKNIFSSTNIICSQEQVMSIGGAVAKCPNLYVYNVIVIGNISLGRGKGDGINVNTGSSKVSSLFYAEPHNIGGLVGECSTSYTQDIDSVGTIVLSSIRDYALAQKLQLSMGPVVGTNNRMIANETNTYFCEPIALVPDNGYNAYFKSIDQTKLVGNATREYEKIYKGIFKNSFSLDTSTDIYSNYYKNYKNKGTDSYKSGTKLSPTALTTSTTIEANKYYVLTSNYSGSLSTTAKGWVLNGQGKAINASSYVINEIPEDAAIVGVMIKVNNTSGKVFATTNNGFLFACGSSGLVSASTSAGLVLNNYGVINTCFSIANIKANGAASGLVNINGNADKVGNIYSCYYSGTITPTHANANIAGLVGDTQFGIVSNCYTIGDLDITGVKPKNTYPIANTNNKYNLYNTYYDYIAYAGLKQNADGKSGEGISATQARNIEICRPIVGTSPVAYTNIARLGADGKDKYGLITDKGVYVWSSTLAGDENGLNYTKLSDTLKGSWLKPGDEQQISALFAKSDLGSTYETAFDTSWFNYGYTTNNMLNIIVNEPGATDGDAIRDYLLMLYTGNGLKPISNTTGASPVKSYGTFIDQPYHIKHAGMLDILVRSNNSDGVVFKYYILDKNIDFVKYSKETYWSESWDKTNVSFVGDFDGNGKTIMNMYSSHGLLRSLPKVNSITENTVVKNFTIKDSYAKTGLVAGFQSTGTIQQVAIQNSYVVNGDWTTFITGASFNLDNAQTYNTELELVSFKEYEYKNIKINIGDAENPTMSYSNAKFAGGFVGMMQGGAIAQTNAASNLTVTAVDLVAQDISYIGGFVGVMTGGTIQGTSTSNYTITGVNVYSVFNNSATGAVASKSYVGTVAGVLGQSDSVAKLNYLVIASSNKVSGYYSVGGIAGQINGGEINNCTINISTSISAANAKINTNSTITPDVAVLTPKLMIGGATGEMVNGTINSTSLPQSTSLSLSTNFGFADLDNKNKDITKTVSLGGMAGEMKKGTIISSTITNNLGMEVGSKLVKVMVGGMAGYMYDGKIDGTASVLTQTSSSISASSNEYAIAGGIVGYMTEGEITQYVINSAGVSANDSAGGIVGEIYATEKNSITIKAKTYSGTIQATDEGSKAGGTVGYLYLNNKTSTDILINITEATIETAAIIGSEKVTYSGGIVGLVYNNKAENNNIVISKCTNKATLYANGKSTVTGEDEVTGASFTGGIVGFAKHLTISECTNSGSMGATVDNSAYYAGGIAGFVQCASIMSSNNTGGTIAGKWLSGGLIGAIVDGVLTGDFTSSNASVINVSAGVSGGLFGTISGGTQLTAVTSYTNSSVVGSSLDTQPSLIAGGIVGIYNGSAEKLLTTTTNNGAVTTFKGSIAEKFLSLKASYDEGVVLSSANSFIDDTFANNDSAGGIVGYAKGELTIKSATVTNSATIKAAENAGGVVGTSKSTLTITKSTNAATVKDSVYAGGIIAQSTSNLILATINEAEPTDVTFGNISNSGNIIATTAAGGIVGYLDGTSNKFGHSSADGTSYTITNTGTVGSGSGSVTTQTAGGLIGVLKETKIYGAKNAGQVASVANAGGLVGQMYSGELANSNIVEMGTKTVSAGTASDDTYAGGVVGYIEGGKTYVNVTSVAFGSTNYIGGLAGTIRTSTPEVYGVVSANVTGGKIAAGGIAGLLDAGGQIRKDKVVNVGGTDVTYTASAEGKSVTAEQYVGGVVGLVKHSDCDVKGGKGGNPSGTTANAVCGGVVGLVSAGKVSGGKGGNAVSSTSKSNGGVVGYLEGSSTVQGTYDSATTTYSLEGGQAKNASENNGGIVGYMEAGFVKGYAKGGEADKKNAGGIVGYMESGEISGSVEGTKVLGGDNVGGVVGSMLAGVVKGSLKGAEVAGGTNAGGVVGLMEGADCEISGSVTGGKVSSSGTNAGGIVGHLKYGTVKGGTGGEVTSSATNVGGIAGLLENDAVISNGTGGVVNATASSSNAGGIVGQVNASDNSHEAVTNGTGGEVKNGESSGGIAGYLKKGTIKGGKNESNVKASTNAGGLVGKMDKDTVLNGGTTKSTITGKYAGGYVGYASGGAIAGGTNTGCTVSGTDYSGGVVGYSAAASATDLTIECSTKATITSGTAGGILGRGGATITGGTFEGTITSSNAGGVVGKLDAQTVKLESITIKVTGIVAVITNENDGTITTANDGSVSSINASNFEGSLVNKNTNGATISYLKASSIKKATSGSYYGSVVKENVSGATVDHCENSTSFSDVTISRFGGIVGTNAGTISNCSNSGTISGSSTYIGGIVGYISGGSVTDCSNTVAITQTSANYAGGIVGYINAGSVSGSGTSNSGAIKYNGTGNEASTGMSNYEDDTHALAFIGGIAGYANGGSVEGYNTGSISNDIEYTSSDSSATIYDYRGQIAGGRGSGTVKNLAGKTGFTDTVSQEATGNILKYYVTVITIQKGGAVWGMEDRKKQQKAGVYTCSGESEFENLTEDTGQGEIDNYIESNIHSKVSWTKIVDMSIPDESSYLIQTESWAYWSFTEAGLRWFAGQKGYNLSDWTVSYRCDSTDINAGSDINYWGILGLKREEAEMRNVYDFTPAGLQDCGGYVYSSGGENQSQQRVNALISLYNKCD